MAWGHVLLLCSDGLTRHVSDERIRDVLRSMKSAKQPARTCSRQLWTTAELTTSRLWSGEHYRGMSDVRSPGESYRASQLEVARLNAYGLE
jgi:hypothetical protein